jgi:hypothetical protein
VVPDIDMDKNLRLRVAEDVSVDAKCVTALGPKVEIFGFYHVPYITSPGTNSGPRQKTVVNKEEDISSGDRHKKCVRRTTVP